ncbi:hypothetical protein ABZS96_36470 [Streptomyces avermitilis]|uniref:hypothetical protein n=1 Tax=Streptomyces avermitilis TaxID=33903 RepID=UPI0033BE97A9
MTRPSLLRRAAAAALGVDRRPARATALTPARDLTLARRAAAAVIGIRSYRDPGPTTARTPHPAGNFPSSMRVWEVRRRPGALTRRPATGTLPPEGEDDAAHHASLSPSHESSARPDRPARAGDPTPLLPVVIGASGVPASRQRPRRAPVLAAAAAVLAVALGALAYGTAPSPNKQPPSPNEQPPSRVVAGDVPDPYVGTWTNTITNADGENTRTLVIKQGRIGDEVLTLTADGPHYHCDFRARLVSVTSGSIRLSSSTVATGSPAGACEPGGPTAVAILSDGRLQRTNDTHGETLTYTRSR